MKILLSILVVLSLAYLLLLPVPIEPQSWAAPANQGYTGVHLVNNRLASMQAIQLAPNHGPEDITGDTDGTLFSVTAEGSILAIKPDESIETIARVGGRPLGIELAADGAIIVANAGIGLQRVTRDGKIGLLTKKVAGSPIHYANNLAIASDGRIYFSDASTRFNPDKFGGTYAASLLDLMEHSANSRILVYDPGTKTTEVVLENLSFANGVAIDPAERYLLIAETGEYRIWRFWLAGPRRGEKEIILDNLPGFPDNIDTGLDGRFWIGLVAPRSAVLDKLSSHPLMRKAVWRLPAPLRPGAKTYSHVIAINGNGIVLADLQHDGSIVASTTGVYETESYLYVSSLFGSAIGRLPKAGLELP